MTSPSDRAREVEAFVPSLEKARKAETSLRTRVWWRKDGVDLLAREPTTARKLAAVLTVVRRGADSASQALLRYPYVPSMPFALEEGAARVFERFETHALPECLRVEVERKGGGDPYRGLPGGASELFGFDYADAVARARSRLLSLRAAHPHDDLSVATYAWPILRLTYRGFTMRREVALLVRPDGVLHALLSRAALFG